MNFAMIMGLANIAVDLVGKISEMKRVAERDRQLTEEQIAQLDAKIKELTESNHWQRRE